MIKVILNNINIHLGENFTDGYEVMNGVLINNQDILFEVNTCTKGENAIVRMQEVPKKKCYGD